MQKSIFCNNGNLSRRGNFDFQDLILKYSDKNMCWEEIPSRFFHKKYFSINYARHHPSRSILSFVFRAWNSTTGIVINIHMIFINIKYLTPHLISFENLWHIIEYRRSNFTFSYQYLVHIYQKESTATKVLSQKSVDVCGREPWQRKLEVSWH